MLLFSFSLCLSLSLSLSSTSSRLQERQGLAPHSLRRRQPRRLALPLPHCLAPALRPVARLRRRPGEDPERALGSAQVPRGVLGVGSHLGPSLRQQNLGFHELRHRARGQQVGDAWVKMLKRRRRRRVTRNRTEKKSNVYSSSRCFVKSVAENVSLTALRRVRPCSALSFSSSVLRFLDLQQQKRERTKEKETLARSRFLSFLSFSLSSTSLLLPTS